MSWAEESDLLLGDMETGHLDKTRYLEIAEDEINSYLGSLYALPIPDTLSVHNLLALKVMQARLASGRLFLALAAGGEDAELHAYGRHLLELAMTELNRIGRDYELMTAAGEPLASVASTGESRAPVAIGPADTSTSTSPFDIYERNYHKPAGYWVDVETWVP